MLTVVLLAAAAAAIAALFAHERRHPMLPVPMIHPLDD